MIKTVPYHSMTSLSTTSNFLSQFKYCCCCIPIRTGCFILGYLNLIANLLYSIYFVAFILHNAFLIDEVIDVETVLGEEDEDSESKVNNFLNIYGPIILYSLIRLTWIIICVCCLVGLHKKNPGPIRVFIGFATARIVVQLFIFIHSLLNTGYPMENIIAECIELGLASYFLMTYYLHVLQLEREKSEESFPSEVVADDIAFVYPTTIDKDLLVSKDKF